MTGERGVVDEVLFGPPEKLRIPAEGPIEYVGRLDDGTQYMSFTTGGFPDGYLFSPENDDWRKVKSWIGVLHLFDPGGNHLKTEARHGGYDIEGRDVACERSWAEVDAMLAPYRGKGPKRCDIFVKLFSVAIDGITHGLIYRTTQPEEGGPVFEAVLLEPPDVMFHPPWDSGEWST
jgi:hypothetical protein